MHHRRQDSQRATLDFWELVCGHTGDSKRYKMIGGVMDDPAISIRKSLETGVSGRRYPSKLFVEVTPQCNLRCSMCVKQNEDGGVPEGSMSPAVFDALAPAFPHLDALVLS